MRATRPGSPCPLLGVRLVRQRATARRWLAELDEERLQSAGRYQCQRPGLLAVHCQQVRDVSWAEDEGSWGSAERVVANAHGKVSPEDEERFVLSMVNVGWGLRASGEHALHQTEGARGLLRGGENGDQLPYRNVRRGIPDVDSKR
jgi:hypothetical protein